jgi:hypothetical protein
MTKHKTAEALDAAVETVYEEMKQNGKLLTI